MKIINNAKRVLPALALALLAMPAAAAGVKPILNYADPSQKWMGSLPLGNGRLGAMVYGGINHETIAMNEVTMWSGQPEPEANDLCGKERLQEMRELFLKGDIAAGNRLGNQYLSGHGKSFGTNLPVGDIKLDFLNATGKASGYSRKLDMSNAVATVSYKQNGVSYTREYFVSNPAQVMAVRLTANKKQSLSFRLSVNMLRHAVVNASDEGLDIMGDARFNKNGEGGVKYRKIIRVIPKGGSVGHDADAITVEGADEVLILCDIRTNYQQPNFESICQQTVSQAAATAYKNLKKAHTADFSAIFNRMDIRLGNEQADANATTDALFAQAHNGNPSTTFDALFFQYGRYMLISSSRENAPLPANLQGIWNDNLACNMPWTCDYHLDINIQQNYWSANIANMAETNVPLFRYITLLSQFGHETAKKMYGCNGWVAHTINNVWGHTAPGGGVGWAMNVTAGAWLATQLWTHYDFTRDDEWLRREGYPLIKKTAEFFVDYMIRDPKTGYLLTGPSISPENSFRYTDGHDYNLSMMPTTDRAVVYDIYQACIKASKILNTDQAFRQRLEHDIKLLPPYKVGQDGGLCEWLMDVRRSDPSHRHASHLLGLYPFGEISPERTPELAKACERFLELQTKHGSWEDTEWTRGNMINFYARLLNGEEAYKSIIGLYTGFMRENLMTVSPAGVAGANEDIFSFDATEAAVSGACEMLLQSYDGYLNFLPALPVEWKDGEVKGICARGGIKADFQWKDGKVVAAKLTSNNDQTVECKINGQRKTVNLKKNKTIKLI